MRYLEYYIKFAEINFILLLLLLLCDKILSITDILSLL